MKWVPEDNPVGIEDPMMMMIVLQVDTPKVWTFLCSLMSVLTSPIKHSYFN